jgi:predicted GIY-YIG superfamily endonuclease
MAFYVYILRCADGSYYTGHTDNLESRLAAHERGEIPGYTQTKTRRPVELVFAEEFPSREDALGCERQIKGWSRAKKEALIARDWARLVDLARTRAGTEASPVRGELVEP